MANTSAFFDRLTQLGVSPGELLSFLTLPEDAFVLGYTSHIDGFGTAESDLDVYVCSSTFSQRWVETPVVGGVLADVEYLPLAHVEQLVKTLESADLNDPEVERGLPSPALIKLLYRMAVGARLHGPANDWAARIPMDKLQQLHIRLHRLAVDDVLDDALRHYQAGDGISAVYMGRKAFDHAVLAYLASKGTLVFKPKWVYSAIVQCLGTEDVLYHSFLRYHFGITPGEAMKAAEAMMRDAEQILLRLS